MNAQAISMRGEKVSLRAAEPSDLDLLYILENDSDRAMSSFTTAPASRHMLWQYLDSYKADIYAEKQLRLIVTLNDTGEAIGAVDISDYDARDRRGFVGIAIAPQYRGLGYGTEALQLLCAFASSTLGMHQLAAVTTVDNMASRALFAAAGFDTAGRLRSWVRTARHYTDVLIYQRLFP